MRGVPHCRPRPSWGRLWGVLGVACAIALVGADGSTLAAALLLTGVPAPDEESMAGMLAWIGGGAVVLGVGGFLATTLSSVVLSTTVGAALGVAVGGGLGAIVYLLLGSEETADETETMTVDMAEDSAGRPRPADLFASHPDPLIYYAGRGDGPTVTTVNPGYAETFGRATDEVAGAPLGDAIGATGAVTDLLAAIEAGEEHATTLTCETIQGAREFRVRPVTVEANDGLHGYLVYVALDA
jgi:hypothetical protein